MGHGDRDVFAVTAEGPANITITVSVMPPMTSWYDGNRADFDTALLLTDAAGQVVGRANAMTSAWPDLVAEDHVLAAALVAYLPAAGTYHITVAPGWLGDARNGYSNYGSMGQYAIRASFEGGWAWSCCRPCCAVWSLARRSSACSGCTPALQAESAAALLPQVTGWS